MDTQGIVECASDNVIDKEKWGEGVFLIGDSQKNFKSDQWSYSLAILYDPCTGEMKGWVYA